MPSSCRTSAHRPRDRSITRGPLPEPGTLAAVGVTQVQIATAPGSGSPDATPWRNTRDLGFPTDSAGAAVSAATRLRRCRSRGRYDDGLLWWPRLVNDTEPDP